jgi:hypothetical protein
MFNVHACDCEHPDISRHSGTPEVEPPECVLNERECATLECECGAPECGT